MSVRIIEPERLTITARRDLRISRRTERGESFHFVEDPLRNKFFRLGDAEHALFSELDGTRTIAEAAEATAATTGPNALTEAEAVQLAEWLVNAGLASHDIGAATRPNQLDAVTSSLPATAWNPWSFRIPFGCPDGWLHVFDPLGRLLFSRAFFVVWVTTSARQRDRISSTP